MWACQARADAPAGRHETPSLRGAKRRGRGSAYVLGMSEAAAHPPAAREWVEAGRRRPARTFAPATGWGEEAALLGSDPDVFDSKELANKDRVDILVDVGASRVGILSWSRAAPATTRRTSGSKRGG